MPFAGCFCGLALILIESGVRLCGGGEIAPRRPARAYFSPKTTCKGIGLGLDQPWASVWARLPGLDFQGRWNACLAAIEMPKNDCLRILESMLGKSLRAGQNEFCPLYLTHRPLCKGYLLGDESAKQIGGKDTYFPRGACHTGPRRPQR